MSRLNNFYGSSVHNTPTYNSWLAMKSRCFNESNNVYHLYGGRGITVCDKWLNFEGFFEDMGYRPEGTTIERINSDRNYEPGNCRWATAQEQANNISTNHRIEYNGQTKTLAEWSRDGSVVNQFALSKRLSRGWTPEQALTLPVGEEVNSRASEKSLATRFQPKMIEHNGKRQSIKDWSKELGFVTSSALSKRIAAGMPLEKALTPPDARKQTVIGKVLNKSTNKE
jgi:hypothetical protein